MRISTGTRSKEPTPLAFRYLPSPLPTNFKVGYISVIVFATFICQPWTGVQVGCRHAGRPVCGCSHRSQWHRSQIGASTPPPILVLWGNVRLHALRENTLCTCELFSRFRLELPGACLPGTNKNIRFLFHRSGLGLRPVLQISPMVDLEALWSIILTIRGQVQRAELRLRRKGQAYTSNPPTRHHNQSEIESQFIPASESPLS